MKEQVYGFLLMNATSFGLMEAKPCFQGKQFILPFEELSGKHRRTQLAHINKDDEDAQAVRDYATQHDEEAQAVIGYAEREEQAHQAREKGGRPRSARGFGRWDPRHVRTLSRRSQPTHVTNVGGEAISLLATHAIPTLVWGMCGSENKRRQAHL